MTSHFIIFNLNISLNLKPTCTICHKHLKDGSVKNGLIKCETCKKEFLVKDIKIKENKFAKIVLDSEQHLSNEEKQVKSEIHDLLNKFQELNENSHKIDKKPN
jgi:ribosomal protein L37AE/L43A